MNKASTRKQDEAKATIIALAEEVANAPGKFEPVNSVNYKKADKMKIRTGQGSRKGTELAAVVASNIAQKRTNSNPEAQDKAFKAAYKDFKQNPEAALADAKKNTPKITKAFGIEDKKVTGRFHDIDVDGIGGPDASAAPKRAHINDMQLLQELKDGSRD